MSKNIIVKYNVIGPTLLGFGGSLYVAFETAIAFAKKGYNVCFDPILLHKKTRNLLMKIKEFYGVPEHDLINIHIGKCVKNNSITMNLTGDFLSGKADIVYMHFPVFAKPRIYYPGLHGVYSLSANLYYIANLIYKSTYFKKTKLVIANSSFTKKYLKQYIDKDIVIVYPPVNLEDILDKKPLSRTTRDKIILFVSRLSYEKQPYKVLIVAEVLEKLGLKDWKIICAGSSSIYTDKLINSIQEIARRRNLDKYIIFLRDLPRIKLVELYRKAYVYVHLTSREHFGITIIEAMAAGTPVIIPRSNSAWTDVALKNANIALSYSDYNELKELLTKIIYDDKLWSKLSIASRERAKYFNRTRFHEEITKLVEEKLGI